MNIICRTYGGATVFRPDTTWERYSRDFYPPDMVSEISLSVCLFTQVTRPGKCIGEKFAPRYFSEVHYGVLLYPENLVGNSPEGFAEALTLDHTSCLTLPSESGYSSFMLKVDGKEVFTHCGNARQIIGKGLVEATGTTLLRNGDILAVEISRRIPVHRRESGNTRIEGITPEGVSLDFNIVVE